MSALLRDALAVRTLALLALLLVASTGLASGEPDETSADDTPANDTPANENPAADEETIEQEQPAALTDEQAYLRFQALARGLPPADAARAFAFKGRVLRDGVHGGTWAMQAKPEGKAGDWRIEEIIRLDGELVARRKVLLSRSLYPIHGSAVVRRETGTTELTWRGEGDQLLLTRTPLGDKTLPAQQRFGAVALSGLAPYVLIGGTLRAHPGRLRTVHVYDGADGPPQIAARDLRVERAGQWGEGTADLLIFARPWPATVAFDSDSGALLGFRVPTRRGALEVVPFAPTEEAGSAWDLLTNPSTTPAIAALRFLYALERGYLTLAESLVAWPADLLAAGDGAADRTTSGRRAWIEARRIELLAELPPARAAQELQSLLPRLETLEQEGGARVRLPAPYAGWILECTRGDGADTWLVRSAAYEPAVYESAPAAK